MSEKLWYNEEELRRDVSSLCRNIVLDKFDPQVIVGLSRGGLVPGVMMSHWFQKPFKLMIFVTLVKPLKRYQNIFIKIIVNVMCGLLV